MSGNPEGGGNWKKKPVSFAKLLWWNLSLFWILLETHWRGKGDSEEGLMCSAGDWGAPHISSAGAGVALSLFLLRVFQQVPGRLWRGEAHNSAQSPCPFPSILWVKKGSAGFGKGKKQRALHSISALAPSFPPTSSTGDLHYLYYTGGTKRNYLACLGQQFSSSWDISVLWKGNAMKSNSRGGWAVWSDSLPKRQSLWFHWHFITYGIWGYQSMIKYHTLSPGTSIKEYVKSQIQGKQRYH